MPLTGVGAGGWICAGALADVLAVALAAAGVTAGLGLVASVFNALLEMTKRRRTGGALIFGALGELARVDLDTLTLRFDIKIQTKKYRAGSEKLTVDRKNTASDEIPEFVAVTLELRTPED
jgi:hypothetical protein